MPSTNEELETSKEELQSLNEELVTVNAELHGKIEDLSRANDDMKNLLDSTRIATLFLDNQLRIRRFTSEATKIINLIQSDVGRPVSHIVGNLEQDTLSRDAQEVLDSLVLKERAVRTKDGRWYLNRVIPYRTLDNVIDGVVITFTDFTAQKTAESIQAARNLAEGIVETVGDPLIALDGKFASCRRQFGLLPALPNGFGRDRWPTLLLSRKRSMEYPPIARVTGKDPTAEQQGR